MAGTKEGGKKAAATNMRKWGKDFYKNIGSEGGKKSSGYDFAHGMVDPEVAGSKGGKVSRRVKK
jgi:general stress protein YciG